MVNKSRDCLVKGKNVNKSSKNRMVILPVIWITVLNQ